MIAVITKASDNKYVKFFNGNINALKELIKEEGAIIIEDNDWAGISTETIKEYWKVDGASAKQISKAEYHITIYDDYVE